MKKIAKGIIMAALALSTTLSMASCGDSPKDTSSASESSVSSQTEPVTSKPDSSSAASGETTPTGTKFATMKEYAESPEVQKQMETMADLYKDSGLTFTMTGEGNKLIYTYTYPEGTVTTAIKDAMDGVADQMSPSFELIAESLKSVVEVDNPVLVVKYLDADGTELYSREFSSSSSSQLEL